MASTTINPTRMEMQKLKAKLATATKGHRLLKDKRDELMKQFLEVVRANQALREKVETELAQAQQAFSAAAAVMSPEMLETALAFPKQGVSLTTSTRNMMGVIVPQYHFRTTGDPSDSYPYGFAQTSAELDTALETFSEVFRDLLELAQAEKTMQLLSSEIEKTRRRVNALEYVMIPEYTEKIKYISMKLDENERASTTRLMKVKDMILIESRK